MMHKRVNITRWKAEFPLAKLRNQARRYVLDRQKHNPKDYPSQEAVLKHIALMSPGGESITGPYEIAVVEQLRDEAASRLTKKKFKATDVFVFAKGETQKRALTKIGGLPYRSAGKPWPVSRDAHPLTFVAQFCFADSQDVVGPLPGDVLLIFADGEYGVRWDDGNQTALVFEWVKLGEKNFIQERQMPRTDWEIFPCYGAIHRTKDYVNADLAFGEYKQDYLLDIIQGTKIGGVPSWVQDEEGFSGKFLCSLGSINPKSEIKYPFINAKEPFDYWNLKNRQERDALLCWMDVGVMNIFFTKKGLRWSVQSY